MVMFTHSCPYCGRKRRLQIALLGQRVACFQCQKEAIATDRDNESLAMFDTVKAHAELTNLPFEQGIPNRLPK